MNESSCVAQAYPLMRAGKLDAALEVLEADVLICPQDLERDTLRYLLYRQRERLGDALQVTEACLQLQLTDIQKCTWLLRKGMCLLELKRKTDAARVFHEVLATSDQSDHHRQAREALVRLTQGKA